MCWVCVFFVLGFTYPRVSRTIIGEISMVIPLFRILLHMVSACPRQYGDSRTWHQRLVRQQLDWQPLLPSPTQAYHVASSPGTPTTCQDQRSLDLCIFHALLL